MDVLLALGGGGVKGAAHLGVIRVLERAGIKVKGIAGSSAGAMIGAFYCTGHSVDEIQERLVKVEQNHIYQRHSGDRPSFLGLDGAARLIKGFVGDNQLEELSIPLYVTATNLDTGQAVVFKEGRVLDAVLASIAVPGLFPVQYIQSIPLVDGGVTDPVPVRVARSITPNHPVVAVVLTPEHKNWQNIADRKGMFTSIPVVGHLAERLIWAKALEVFMSGFDIANLLFTDLHLRLDQPEVLLRPNIHHVGVIDQINVDEIAMAGEVAALESLAAIRLVTHGNSVKKRFTRQLAKWINHYYPALSAELLRQNNEP